MTADGSRTTATYADLEAVPPHLVAEILCGVLVTHPRPAPRHATAASRLGAILTPPFDFGDNGPGGWRIIDEPELHLDADVAVPDLAGWRRERLPELPETAHFTVPPDWVCEVLSPSTERYDRTQKRVIYARHGVRHLWLLDPVQRLLETFELREGAGIGAAVEWVLLATWQDDQTISAPPFDAAPFNLGKLWG